MAIAVTASEFSKLPSELLGIEEPEIALPFNVECASVLFRSQLDRELRVAEMVGLGQLEAALGGDTSSRSNTVGDYEVW